MFWPERLQREKPGDGDIDTEETVTSQGAEGHIVQLLEAAGIDHVERRLAAIAGERRQQTGNGILVQQGGKRLLALRQQAELAVGFDESRVWPPGLVNEGSAR